MSSPHREVSLRFLEAFCEGRVEDLRPLLAEDLRFEGPLHRSETREAYLSALEEDPPEVARAEVHAVLEGGDDVCLWYTYHKGEASALMAQWNRFRGGQIAEIRLLFDAGALGR